MKKVSYDKVEHTISTKGKKGSKKYAFNDFSNSIKPTDFAKLKKLSEKMKSGKPKKKKGKPNKIVKVKPAAGSMRINRTHILIPCEPWTRTDVNGNTYTGHEQWIVINRYLTVNKVRSLYPNVLEMVHSIDDEVYGDAVIFANAK